MPRTVACEIGKHKLCNGTGNTEEGEQIKCDCPCHGKTNPFIEGKALGGQ